MIKNIFKTKKEMNKGYTIIETMISITIFLVVLMIGMNSLLNASFIHEKSRDQRSIMDNLTFIMEEMSRNIRTGYNYRCIVGEVFQADVQSSGNIAQDCYIGQPSGGFGSAIVFENASGFPENAPGCTGSPECLDDQWVYKMEGPVGGSDLDILKSVNGAANFIQLNPEEIKFDQTSGFYVTGAASTGDQQPLVTIKLNGKITTKKGQVTPFSLQTTVSQRLIDSTP